MGCTAVTPLSLTHRGGEEGGGRGRETRKRLGAHNPSARALSRPPPLPILPPQQANPFHSINTPAGRAPQRPLPPGPERPSQEGRRRPGTNTVSRPRRAAGLPRGEIQSVKGGFAGRDGVGGDPQGGRFTFQTESGPGKAVPVGGHQLPFPSKGGSIQRRIEHVNVPDKWINTLRPGPQGEPADHPLRAGLGDPGAGSGHVLAGPLQPTPLGPRQHPLPSASPQLGIPHALSPQRSG